MKWHTSGSEFESGSKLGATRSGSNYNTMYKDPQTTTLLDTSAFKQMVERKEQIQEEFNASII